MCLWERGIVIKDFLYSMFLILLMIMDLSSIYIIDSYHIWHARLGHVNYTYVLK